MNEIDRMKNDIVYQDNRCTEDPIFLAQKEVREYGIDPDYDYSGYIWYDLNGGVESSDEDVALLEAGAGPLSDRFRHEKRYYRNRWETITPFFTEKAADHFLKLNHYHWGKTRVYVDSAWRNNEWQAIREMLINGE